MLGDERTNTLTLIGAPRQVEIASAQLTQLDIRRRQVAVNVKIVDVNLLGTDAYNASFSFGIGDSFFSSDGGAASFNFGGVNPPSATTVRNPGVIPPITGLPLPSGVTLEPFLDPQGDAPFGDIQQAPNFPYARPNFGTVDNPFQPGVTDVTATDIEFSLPGLFQFPRRLLAALQAQITSGNAKILTDPTIIVQEGQTATVALTQEVPTTTGTTTITEEGVVVFDQDEPKLAGLTLSIEVNRIDDNGFVGLSVAPTVASPQGTQTNPDGSITQLLASRTLQSGQIRLRDGQTLILSGIIQESDTTTVTKIPILGDLPIIGALFRSTNRSNQRQEVIVLLTPQILDDSQGSSFGYNYTPGRDAQQLLERRDFQTPGGN